MKKQPRPVKRVAWVRLTKEHIRTGVKLNPRSCPIAKAIKQATKRKVVEVGPNYWTFTNDRRFLPGFTLPQAARDFIKKFDQSSRNLKPFRFKIRYSI